MDVSSAGHVVVSVVVPVFNPGAYLLEQLECLAAQDFRGTWEVVLADNGSSDESLARVDDLAESLTIVVVDASDRQGASHARNVGAASARGDWIAFCDADDRVTRNWLSNLFAARDTADILAGGLDVVGINPPEIALSRGTADYWKDLLPGPCHFLAFAPTSNLLVRRDVFHHLGGFDVTLPYCEDVDFSWRAQLAGRTLALAPDALVEYRFRSSIRGTFRQTASYQAAEPELYIRYRSQGARRQRAGEVLERVWWLLSRGAYVLLDRRRRYLWWSIAGGVLGRMRGSLRYRVLYL